MRNLKVTRRQFVTGAVATGYAMAIRPVGAAAIHTDDDGLDASLISLPVTGNNVFPPRPGYGARDVPAYMAKPKGDGPFPIIIVIHEIFDLHEFIFDVCRRFAKQGYLAIAPSLFAREGDAARMTDIGKIITDVAAKTPDDQVMSDIVDTVLYAAQHGGNGAVWGITGFCWGGRIAWLYEAFRLKSDTPTPKAAVAWYGMVGKNPFSPKEVLEVVPLLDAPVLGLYGGKDDSIPVATLEQMREKLKAANNPSEIIIYPDAGHGFFADYRPSYDPQAAAEAWAKCVAWFKKYLA